MSNSTKPMVPAAWAAGGAESVISEAMLAATTPNHREAFGEGFRTCPFVGGLYWAAVEPWVKEVMDEQQTASRDLMLGRLSSAFVDLQPCGLEAIAVLTYRWLATL